MTDGQTRHRFLNAATKKNTLSAYLIICARRSVAQNLVNDFLKRLYCRQGGCGVCSDCAKVINGHVDIMRMDAPKVAAIRNAIGFIAEKPADGAYKCIVIENADDMTDAAANSMLKTIEQPPANTTIILEAASVSGVLPTIASRCAAVYLTPDKDAKQKIIQTLNVDERKAHILTALSGGFVEEATRIYQDSAFWPLRDTMVEYCHKLLSQKGTAISLYADFLETNKARISVLLFIMQSYYRDILIYQKTKNMHLLINMDEAEHIISAANHFTSGAISNMINVILEAERRFIFSVNFRLAVEKMLFDILEERNSWKK